MGLIVERKGKKIEIKVAQALDWLSAQAIGIIQRRTSKGLAIGGAPFAAYSPAYRAQLAAMGETQKVDLTVTGAMLADLREVGRTANEWYGSVTIGPGTGTSEKRKPPSKRTASGKLKKKPPKPRAVKTGQRSPPHNVLAAIHHFGRGNVPARPWVGLSKAEEHNLLVELAKRLIGGGLDKKPKAPT